MTRLVLILAVVAVLFLAFRWWTSGGERQPPETVAAAIADGAQVLDVRTDGEYADGRVAGAVHANVMGDDFDQAVAGLDRAAPVYVYCASGTRSGRAAGKLESMGFAEVVNAGGFNKLVAAGVETEP